MQQSLVEDKIALIESTTGKPPAENEFINTRALLIESRFGPVYINPEKAISFPHGIPGIEQFLSFGLTDIPNASNSQFKFLQCLNNYILSFIVIPENHDSQLLEESDIDRACLELGINKHNLLLLFIVTIHESDSGTKIAINARAPLFVDTLNRIASQYVFPNNNYEIQHFIQ